jgi:mannose-6-phosphate isomerase-like protein (cupin superfamily)
MRNVLAACTLFCIFGFGSATSIAVEEEAPVPVQNASYHVPLFKNEYVTVLRIFIPSQRVTNYHVHDHDLITVVVEEHPPEAFSQKLGAESGKPRGAVLGQVDYNPYLTRPVTHRTHNPGSIPVHVLGVQLNGEKPYGFSPESRDSNAYAQLVDNDRARVWRLSLKPGQSAPAFSQTAPGVRVVVHGGEITETAPGHNPRAMMLRVGDAFWQDSGATRSVQNIGTTPVEFVEIELK